MWLDTNGCPESIHIFKRVDGKVVCLHSDGSECKESEFNVAEAA